MPADVGESGDRTSAGSEDESDDEEGDDDDDWDDGEGGGDDVVNVDVFVAKLSLGAPPVSMMSSALGASAGRVKARG